MRPWFQSYRIIECMTPSLPTHTSERVSKRSQLSKPLTQLPFGSRSALSWLVLQLRLSATVGEKFAETELSISIITLNKELSNRLNHSNGSRFQSELGSVINTTIE